MELHGPNGLLDDSALNQFLKVLLNLLVGKCVVNHGLLAVKGRIKFSLALGFKLDDMEAELGANRSLCDFARLQCRERSAEGRHKGTRNNPAQEAALSLVGCILGEFLSEFAKISALGETGNQVLG